MNNLIKKFFSFNPVQENRRESIFKKPKENIFNYYLNDSSEFFLVKGKNGINYIVVYDKKDNNIIIKRCFNMNGSLIKLVKDDLSVEGLVIRQNGNIVTLYNKKNEIILTKREIKFESIKSEKLKPGKPKKIVVDYLTLI